MQTTPKPIPQVPAKLCGTVPGLTLEFGEAGDRTSCFILPRSATTGFVWVLLPATGLVGELPIHGPRSWETAAILLDSPLALCHAARWLAGRLGMDPGSTAPGWRKARGLWFLVAIDKLNRKPTSVEWSGSPDVEDPAEALAAACMALAPA